MSAARWLVLVLAAIATFFVAGIGTVMLLLEFGQSLFGWHDTIAPEVVWGMIAGSCAALVVAFVLHGRWSASAKRAGSGHA